MTLAHRGAPEKTPPVVICAPPTGVGCCHPGGGWLACWLPRRPAPGRAPGRPRDERIEHARRALSPLRVAVRRSLGNLSIDEKLFRAVRDDQGTVLAPGLLDDPETPPPPSLLVLASETTYSARSSQVTGVTSSLARVARRVRAGAERAPGSRALERNVLSQGTLSSACCISCWAASSASSGLD